MGRTGEITVVVADDHPGFLDALDRAVSTRAGLRLAAAVDDGGAALAALRDHRPTAAIIDQQLPTLSGVGVVAAAQREGLATRIVILSADDSGQLAYEAMQAGAAAVLSKAATLAAICDAVEAVAGGGTVIGPELQAALVDEMRARSDSHRALLTERETEVLRLVAAGNSAPQIARALFVSPSTVRTHVQNVFEKLGVSDRAAAVAEGMRRGLVD